MDAFYYKPEFRLFNSDIKKGKVKIKKLGDVAEFQYGLNETAQRKGDITYIRITDIDENGLLKKNNLTYVNYQDKYKKYKLKKGDVLIARIGATFGKSLYFNEDFDAIFAGYLIRIILNNHNINTKFLFYFFQTKHFWKQASMLVKGGAQPQFNANTLKNLLIPIPPLEIQNRIVEIMDEAYRLKKQKEEEARQLLDSINDYVLSELGITIPEFQNRMTFTVPSADVQGGRLDPRFYSDIYEVLEKSIINSKYDNSAIKDIVIEHNSGDWGLSEKGNDPNLVEVKVIRNVNFDNDFNLQLLDLPTRYIKTKKYEKYKLREGDILLEKSGGSPVQPVGRVALINFDPSGYYYSNFLERLSINNEKCLSSYFFAIMKVLYKYKYTEKTQNQTTGIRNLILKQFFNLKIPLPPLEIQNRIAGEVKRRMQRAEQLQQEAREVLEQAKREVEKMILKND